MCMSFIGIEECAHLGKRAKEEDYEILGDVVCGIEHRGPARARTRAENVRKIDSY